MSAVQRVFLTNIAALRRKYARAWSVIEKGIQQLLARDQQRGLTSALVDLSDPAVMARFGARAITRVTHRQQTKRAVDAVYRHLTPDYLVLLGAWDIVCHQHLRNPSGDEDPHVPSDLPYACDVGYSTDIARFLGPTRVVGRLPDLVGMGDPKYFTAVLGRAGSYRSRPREAYSAYFGISAQVWRRSTALSLWNIFGDAATLHLSPPEGSPWTKRELAPRSHFINCHGAPADTRFYGEPGNFPVAHDAENVRGRLREGVVAAAECCYGAELFDPQLTGGTLGLCSEYLRSGAYAFFGSTTIAYGPDVGNGQADMITQDFLRHVLAGASLGRATLQAQQDYVLKNSVMHAIDLKTLAQFCLLGDPAIHAVNTPREGARDPGRRVRGGQAEAIEQQAQAADRKTRRESLWRKGIALARAANHVRATGKLHRRISTPIDRRLRDALGSIDEFLGRQTSEVVSESTAGLVQAGTAAPQLAAPSRVHMALGKRRVRGAPQPQYVAALSGKPRACPEKSSRSSAARRTHGNRRASGQEAVCPRKQE